jgi:excisionase family DNA binding protein
LKKIDYSNARARDFRFSASSVLTFSNFAYYQKPIMNKKEAAELLGVSTRLVEKYASDGRLGEVTYIRGKTGKQAEYNREAVETLKTALESPDTSLATTTPDARLFAAQLVEAIATREQASIEAIRGLLLESGEQSRSASIRVSEKILLNLTDCRTLTGLSDNFLREAIHSGTLKAKIIGRGYKVKRQDLDEFINNL